MIRIITLLLPLTLMFTPAAFAKRQGQRAPFPVGYARARAAQKGTSNTNPVLAEAVYDYSLGPAAQLTDSVRLFYSNGRGSAFDFNNLAYDFGNNADDPGNRLLVSSYTSFDSVHAYDPPRSNHYYTTAVRAYNPAGKVTQSAADSTQIVYFNYDTVNGRLASTITAQFNGSSYDTGLRHTYTYGIFGSVQRDSVFSRNGTAWTPVRVIVSVNNTLGYPVQRTDNIIAGNMITPLIRSIYAYDPANRPSTVIRQLNIGGSNLRNASKDSFGYASNSIITLHNTYRWDTGTATWILNGEEIRHLDPVFSQPDSVWSRYNIAGSSYDTTVQKLAYNDAGDPVYLRNYNSGGRILSDEVKWYYRLTINGSTLAAPQLTVPASLLSVYPNPADGLLHIGGVAAGAAYRIYNASGQVLQRGSLDGPGNVQLTDLPAGFYTIRLQGAGGVQSATFIRR